MNKEYITQRRSNTKSRKVLVSIVMPVYNAAETVSSSINSILVQRFVDWELLVLDDGSTDNTIEVISGFNDLRIRLIHCDHNFIATLNRGFSEAKGKYIARMDADDLMFPERLMIQYNIMEKRKNIDVCSSWMEAFGENMPNRLLGNLYGEIKDPILKLLQTNIVFHPTVMIRRSFWKNHNLKYREYKYAEDYKLWYEMASLGARFYIEAQPLLYYRISQQQVTNIRRAEQNMTSQIIRWEIIEYLINQLQDNGKILKLFEIHKNLIKDRILPTDIVMQQYLILLSNYNNRIFLAENIV